MIDLEPKKNIGWIEFKFMFELDLFGDLMFQWRFCGRFCKKSVLLKRLPNGFKTIINQSKISHSIQPDQCEIQGYHKFSSHLHRCKTKWVIISETSKDVHVFSFQKLLNFQRINEHTNQELLDAFRQQISSICASFRHLF